MFELIFYHFDPFTYFVRIRIQGGDDPYSWILKWQAKGENILSYMFASDLNATSNINRYMFKCVQCTLKKLQHKKVKIKLDTFYIKCNFFPQIKLIPLKTFSFWTLSLTFTFSLDIKGLSLVKGKGDLDF